MSRFLILGLTLAFPLLGWAQVDTDADFKRQVYDREYTFGLIGHTRGYSINGRYLKYLDGYNKLGFEFEFSKLRHPKEVRIPNQFYNNSRGYVFGRENSFYTVRTGMAYESIIFDKTDQGTISIASFFSGGISWGILKPIYMQILLPDSTGSPVSAQLVTVRYNHIEHGGSNIYGEANYFKGIGESKFRPGIYAKAGAVFDFDFLDKKVTSLEAGISYDYFFTEVPILYEDEAGEDINEFGFLQFYLALNFGYKKQ
tara:strand:- start:115 stop:882 length:768 start_codon:yes stop_codon:yes gene_type:complete